MLEITSRKKIISWVSRHCKRQLSSGDSRKMSNNGFKGKEKKSLKPCERQFARLGLGLLLYDNQPGVGECLSRSSRLAS